MCVRNGIIGGTDLLLELGQNLTEEQKEVVRIIRNSSESMLTLLNDILDLSKIEANKLDMEEKTFVMRDCIESAVDVVASSAFSKDVEIFHTTLLSCPYVVQSDSNRLRQVLVNLLSNSCKFTHKGYIGLTCKANPATPPDNIQSINNNANWYEFHFTIVDTGIGISPEQGKALFKAFTQGDRDTSKIYGGTGLGLAISKMLVEMMHGKIWFTSEVGKGTTFEFTIKCRAVEDVVLPAALNSASNQPLLAGKSCLILKGSACISAGRNLITGYWGMKHLNLDRLPLQSDNLLNPDIIGIDYKLLFAGAKFSLGEENSLQSIDYTAIKERLLSIKNLFPVPIILMLPLMHKQRALRILSTANSDQFIAGTIFYPIKAIPLYTALTNIFAKNKDNIIHTIQQRSDIPAINTNRSDLSNTNNLIPFSSSLITPSPNSLNNSPNSWDTNFALSHPLRILIAEDNVINQKILIKMLARLGYSTNSIYIVENGQLAVQTIQTNNLQNSSNFSPFHVILMDLQMPVLNGDEATRNIRILESQYKSSFEPVYIVAVTANAMSGDREDCLSSGMDNYLSKPITMSALCNILQQAYAKFNNNQNVSSASIDNSHNNNNLMEDI